MSEIIVIESAGSQPADLRRVVDAIGDPQFGSELMAFLDNACGAKHCAVFSLGGEAPREVAALSLDGTSRAHQSTLEYLKSEAWRRDPTLIAARERALSGTPALLRLNIDALQDEELRDRIYARLSERLVLCGRLDIGPAAISLLGSDYGDHFTSDGIASLNIFAPLLLSLVGKHIGARTRQARFANALTSLGQIEEVMLSSPEPWSRRELQVCSRILLGVASAGIAAELGISEETAMTYRKRAYQRLGIGTQRELLLWYLSRYGSMSAEPTYSSFSAAFH